MSVDDVNRQELLFKSGHVAWTVMLRLIPPRSAGCSSGAACRMRSCACLIIMCSYGGCLLMDALAHPPNQTLSKCFHLVGWELPWQLWGFSRYESGPCSRRHIWVINKVRGVCLLKSLPYGSKGCQIDQRCLDDFGQTSCWVSSDCFSPWFYIRFYLERIHSLGLFFQHFMTCRCAKLSSPTSSLD